MNWLTSLNDKIGGLVAAGLVALLVMWRDISILKVNLTNHKDVYRAEMDEVKRAADRQEAALDVLETRMGAQDVILARIDENIKTILAGMQKAD